jgi:hypothetical protein
LARGWAISGIGDRTREAATAAAEEAGMPVGAWVEQALGKALAEGLEAGVSIEEIEALLRLEAAVAASRPMESSSPVSRVRTRMRQRRGR